MMRGTGVLLLVGLLAGPSMAPSAEPVTGRVEWLRRVELASPVAGVIESVHVAPGDRVEAGQVIGHMGSTGRSTGPHLHFEVRIDDHAVDPLDYLRR